MPLYQYACLECEHTTDHLFRYEEKPEFAECEACKNPKAEYRVGSFSQFKIGYEQNGRKAFKVDMGSRKQIYRSATRERYEHNAGNTSAENFNKMNVFEKRALNDSVHTKAYKEHLKKENK